MDIMSSNWSFIDKTFVKQSMKCKVCSNFQMYPPGRGILWSRAVLHQSGQLDILRNAIENADYSQTYPLVETSSGQEQYYIRGQLYIFSFAVQLMER